MQQLEVVSILKFNLCYDLVDQKLKPNQYAEYIRFIVDKLLSGKSANEVVRLLESKKKPPGITKWNRKTILGG